MIKPLIDIDAITSFRDVLNELTVLEDELPHNGLKQFAVFNKAYFVVTSAISEGVGRDYFNNPEFVETFTVAFSHYYFAAVNETAMESTKLPMAWKLMNRAATNKKTPEATLLLMGANAHINHDLPLVLIKLIGSETTDDLFKDVLKIDKLLMKSGRTILGTFKEQNRLLDWLKRNVIFLYYRPVMYIILYWRIKAWHSYKLIKKHGVEASNYKRGSEKIAKRFLLLSGLR